MNLNLQTIDHLNKFTIWTKGDEEYEIIFFSKQWVILKRKSNKKEEAWRIDDAAPNHFLKNFAPKLYNFTC